MNTECNTVESKIEESLTMLEEKINLHPDISIHGLTEGMENLIIRNENIDIGVEGAFVEVPVSEVVKNVDSFEKADRLISVLLGEESEIKLQGITRIVGYYSRVTNWNKSKIGELRDRTDGRYGLTNTPPKFNNERKDTIDNM